LFQVKIIIDSGGKKKTSNTFPKKKISTMNKSTYQWIMCGGGRRVERIGWYLSDSVVDELWFIHNKVIMDWFPMDGALVGAGSYKERS
jgi:hypothetical protein